jgi:hypothetical protein
MKTVTLAHTAGAKGLRERWVSQSF